MPLTAPASVRPPFKVSSYSDEAFFTALSSDDLTVAQAACHSRAEYLNRYLKDLNAQTIVEETEYTDRAYLDDFAHYYVRCFKPYERRCRRLHFFSAVFDADQFLAWVVDGAATSELQQAYLGFIVVRPLPEAVIGRTVLGTYPQDGGRRHYPVTSVYDIDLFGTRLTVESLAFQEQDTVLAACATVALWSAFQQCAHHFGTIAPSPAEITAMATTTDVRSRTLPSHGLTPNQMSRAVQAVGLEPEVYECTATLPLNSLIYAYVSAGLPVVLIVDIDGQGHAVTIAGYSLCGTRQIDHEDMAPASPPIRRIGLRINEWYGHDDQVGPFARMLVEQRASGTAGEESALQLSGSGYGTDRMTLSKLVPKIVIVPVYHKIRVTFMDVQRWLVGFNRLAAQIYANFEAFEWDLRLFTTNDYKKAVREYTSPAERERILLRSYPRFLWRARLQTPTQTVVELIFDATDMARSYPFFDAIFFDTTLARYIKEFVRAEELHTLLDALYIGPQFRRFLEQRASAYVTAAS